MITRDDIVDNAEEFMKIVKWWLCDNVFRRSQCMRLGGVEDMVQEAWMRALESVTKPVDVRLTTIAVNAARWTIYSYQNRKITDREPDARLDDIDLNEFTSETSLDDEIDNRLCNAAIMETLKTVTYRERIVLMMRYGLGDGSMYTLEEVGRVLKVSREWVRQVESKAIRKLQHHTRRESLVKFHFNEE